MTNSYSIHLNSKDLFYTNVFHIGVVPSGLFNPDTVWRGIAIAVLSSLLLNAIRRTDGVNSIRHLWKGQPIFQNSNETKRYSPEGRHWANTEKEPLSESANHYARVPRQYLYSQISPDHKDKAYHINKVNHIETIGNNAGDNKPFLTIKSVFFVDWFNFLFFFGKLFSIRRIDIRAFSSD